MAYMIYQQYTTAILDAYKGGGEVAAHLAKAREYRQWLESLTISSTIKANLVEQARTIEEAFERLNT
jgi:hypothetical protein